MSKIKAMTGNQSASIGACLSRPDVIAAYPITPQSSVVEGLAAMIADGKSDAQMVQVESEHSAMSVVQGFCNGRRKSFYSNIGTRTCPYVRTIF
ncbi:MAG: hypothetical protein V8S33_04325 [Intestinibacter bartlettii]